MCDDDIYISAMMSIAHDHDYTILQYNPANSIVHDNDYTISQIDQHSNSTIDNNIETMLSIDEGFGVMHYEPDTYEVFLKTCRFR